MDTYDMRTYMKRQRQIIEWRQPNTGLLKRIKIIYHKIVILCAWCVVCSESSNEQRWSMDSSNRARTYYDDMENILMQFMFIIQSKCNQTPPLYKTFIFFIIIFPFHNLHQFGLFPHIYVCDPQSGRVSVFIFQYFVI